MENMTIILLLIVEEFLFIDLFDGDGGVDSRLDGVVAQRDIDMEGSGLSDKALHEVVQLGKALGAELAYLVA